MRIMKSLLIATALCLFFIGNAFAQSTEGNQVTGRITNRTPDGSIPYGDPVTLQFFDEGNWTSIYTSTLSTDGTFLFTDLKDEMGNDFVTRIVYGETEYFSEPMVFEGSNDVEIVIFEPTDNRSNIQVDQAHFFIVHTEDTVKIAEYYLIGNQGDRTYIGEYDMDTDTFTTIGFSPPSGATNLTFDGPGLGERFVGSEQRFFDTRAIPPGNATIEVSYVYNLPADTNLTIERMLDIPVTSAVFIVSGGEMGLQGSGIEFGGIMDTQMGPAASYTAGPLEPSESLNFQLVPLTDGQISQNLDASPSTPAVHSRNTFTEAAVGVVTLIVGSILAYYFWQAPAHMSQPENIHNLVRKIVELDQQFDNEEIDSTEYEIQRDAIKRRIKSMVRSHKT